MNNLLTPEYIHVLLNPLPLYGLAIGVLALLVSFPLKNRKAQVLALSIVFVSSAAILPTYLSGQKAYHKVYLLADAGGQESLDTHMHRAEKLCYPYYGVALLALCGLLIPLKKPTWSTPLSTLTLLGSIACLALGAWIAKPGGEIRHPEFRLEQEDPGFTQKSEHTLASD